MLMDAKKNKKKSFYLVGGIKKKKKEEKKKKFNNVQRFLTQKKHATPIRFQIFQLLGKVASKEGTERKI